MKRSLTYLLTLVTLCAACTMRNKSFTSLENQGPLALSYDNAFLGTNLFLSHEIEDSNFLYNFFASRGGPTAIELVRKRGQSDPQVLMYYPKDYEFYIASVAKERKTKEWIVRGPFAIERNLARDLGRMEASRRGEPLFEIWGNPMRFKNEGPVTQPKIIVPVFPPTPTPQPVVRRPRRTTGVITAAATPKPSTPTNLDQRALSEAKNLAPRNAAGDILHTVSGPTQTLATISAWYTGSAENAKAIAAKSGIGEDAVPANGTVITVPSGMVKNPMVMK